MCWLASVGKTLSLFAEDENLQGWRYRGSRLATERFITSA